MTSSPAAPLIEYLIEPLELWLADPATEDVAINRPGEAWVYQRGAWQCHPAPLQYDDLHDIAILAGSLREQEVGGDAPLCSSEMPNGERLQVCLPPAVPTGTVSLTFRKFEQNVVPLEALAGRYRTQGWNRWQDQRAARDLSEPLARYDADDFDGFLGAAVRQRLNILFAGATGAGKTTISKSVISAIGRAERVVTIEDTEELKGMPPNCVQLLYSKGGLSLSHVGPDELLQATLRMRPDRVLLGELRDDAAWTWATQICTGHPGAVTTVHGGSAAEAFRRVHQLAKSSPRGAAIDDATLTQMLSDAIDVIVPLSRDGTGVSIRPVWFVADASRRDQTAADLLTMA
jgi:type IV secretion system protein VirB11